jgi:replicative DNA helicase
MDSHDTYKKPPQNIEAEMSVLGGLLLDNDAMWKVTELLCPEDFYLEKHRRIMLALMELEQSKNPCDLITLTTALRKRGDFDQVGGAAYLTTLVDYVPTAANITYYCKIVREMSLARRLVSAGTEIATRGTSLKEDVGELVDYAQKTIMDIADTSTVSGSVHIKALIQSSYKKLQSLYERKEQITGISTGFVDLDKMTAGFHPGNLIIVAGRPSMGKTAFALNIAQHAASRTIDAEPVLVFSLEMGNDELALRLLASEARVDAGRMKTGLFKDTDWPKMARAGETLARSKLYIDDASSLSVLDLRAKARRQKAETGLGMVIVDYLQLMKGNSRLENRQQEISDITRSLKALAKELKIPVVALSQLNRSIETRGKNERRPLMSDLRESGAIEQDADMIMFVYREEVYDKENPDLKGKAEIILVKQRNGPTGTVDLVFMGEYTRFENLSTSEEFR